MKAKMKPHKLLSMLLALVMVVGLLPTVAYAEGTTIDTVYLTYDASKVNLNTAYTEGVVDSQVLRNISSATTGVRVDKQNSGLRYLNEHTIYGIGEGTGQITEGRTYIVRYNLKVASGYDWAYKSDSPAIKFYLNGTETTPYAIEYNSSGNSYKVSFTLGTPSTEPHPHTFDQETIKGAALKTAADCTHDAVYYKSCSCGKISTNDADTFTATDSALGHDYTKKVETEAYLKTAASNCTEYNEYWYACSRCDANAKDDDAATNKYYTSTTAGNHSFTEKIEDAAHYVVGTGTNCQSVKKYCYDCAYCDQIGTTTWDSTTYGEHNYGTDNKCTACGYEKPSYSGGGGGGGGAAPATPQKPEIKPVTGGKVSLSADGTTATITPDAGKVVDKVLVNGKEMGAVTELKGLKTGDKIEVLFKDEVKEPGKAETDKQVKAHMQKLAPKARSLKTKAGNVKVSFEGQFKDIEALGYTVKYKFYRSTKKASGYKHMLTTSKPSYTNTGGKKGTLYYYKAIALAYDKDGKLIAKTELKQCKYASRRWTK